LLQEKRLLPEVEAVSIQTAINKGIDQSREAVSDCADLSLEATVTVSLVGLVLAGHKFQLFQEQRPPFIGWSERWPGREECSFKDILPEGSAVAALGVTTVVDPSLLQLTDEMTLAVGTPKEPTQGEVVGSHSDRGAPREPGVHITKEARLDEWRVFALKDLASLLNP
jgi:hypothetical protein